MKNPWFFNVAKIKPGDGEGHKTLVKTMFFEHHTQNTL